MQEQELQEAGILRKNTTVHKGKGYAAQYTITPSLTFSEQNAGREIGGILGMIPVLNKLVGRGRQRQARRRRWPGSPPPRDHSAWPA